MMKPEHTAFNSCFRRESINYTRRDEIVGPPLKGGDQRVKNGIGFNLSVSVSPRCLLSVDCVKVGVLVICRLGKLAATRFAFGDT